jgi:hypothetical protein
MGEVPRNAKDQVLSTTASKFYFLVIIFRHCFTVRINILLQAFPEIDGPENPLRVGSLPPDTKAEQGNTSV